MERISITSEIIANAPAKPIHKRGRAKGSSPVEREFLAFYNGSDPHAGFKVTQSEYAALRRGVNRANGVDSSKVADYERALMALGLSEVWLAAEGDGNDKVTTLALTRENEVETDE